MNDRNRNRNGHRTRTLRRQVLTEETTCRLCTHPVDKTIPNPHPNAPVVDHLTPLARGGAEYDRTNLGLMHRHCNATKSTRTLSEALNTQPTKPNITASPGWGPPQPT